MNNQPNNNIDPRKLAANAKVVIQPAPTPPKKITLPAGKIQGLGNLPKPTDNPPAKPEQNLQGPTVIQGPTANDSKQQVPDVSKTIEEKTPTVSPAQKEQGKTGSEATQFKPGQSGNPAGRPKKLHSPDAWLETEALKQHGILTDGTPITKAQFLAKTLMEKATDGNIKAIEIVLNRIDGKPMQKIQVIPPEDAAGTVVSKEDEQRLEEMFGR